MSAYGDGLAVKLGLSANKAPAARLTLPAGRRLRPTDNETQVVTSGHASHMPFSKLSNVGSILIPDAQEKRIKRMVEESRQDVRALRKSITKSSKRVSFGLGAGAVATLVLAGVIVADWQKKK